MLQNILLQVFRALSFTYSFCLSHTLRGAFSYFPTIYKVLVGTGEFWLMRMASQLLALHLLIHLFSLQLKSFKDVWFGF